MGYFPTAMVGAVYAFFAHPADRGRAVACLVVVVRTTHPTLVHDIFLV